MTRVARRAALISVTSALIATVAAAGPAGAASPAAPGAGHLATPRSHATAASGHAAAVTTGQQAVVRRYWTRARMEHATALDAAGQAAVSATGQTVVNTTGQAAVNTTGQAAVNAAGPAGSSGTGPVAGGRAGRAAVGVVAEQPARQRTWQSAAVTVTPGSNPVAPARRPGPHRHHGASRVLQRTAAAAATSSGALWTAGGAVARTTGKVFFSLGGHDYVCSGSAVDSANAAVVLTAAHCVVNPGGAWAANWTFVPGYSGGDAPYGSYSARSFYVASQWSAQGENDYDVAFVVVNPATVGGAQVQVGREAGGQAIEFGRQPAQETAFGYPADAPYNGQQLYYCSGTVSADPYQQTEDTGLTCAMTAGSSGGPWLAGFSPATGTGTITSVSSFKYSTDTQFLYGPPLGPVAQSLYTAAQRA